MVGFARTVIDDRDYSKTEVTYLLDQLTAVIDQAGQITTFAYDLYGNLVQASNGGLTRSYSIEPLTIEQWIEQFRPLNRPKNPRSKRGKMVPS